MLIKLWEFSDEMIAVWLCAATEITCCNELLSNTGLTINLYSCYFRNKI